MKHQPVRRSSLRPSPIEYRIIAAGQQRSHGGFEGMLLGSVTQHCVHHATCPVVVVPPRKT